MNAGSDEFWMHDLEAARALIMGHQDWPQVEEDPDSHLHLAEYHLTEYIRGNKWQ